MSEQQKKENIFQKMKRKWDELSSTDKTIIFTSLISGALTSFGWATAHNRAVKKLDQNWNDICDRENQQFYKRGVMDGQIKAYHTLLTQPEKAFKQMGYSGVDVKKF